MYGNDFYVIGYTKYKFVRKFNSYLSAEKYAKTLVSNGYYAKSEIYLVNAKYLIGDYLIKTYTLKDGKIKCQPTKEYAPR